MTIRSGSLLSVVTAALLLPSGSWAGSFESVFSEARELEEEGRFAAAIERYQSIEDGHEGEVSWRIVRSYTDYADSLENDDQRRTLLRRAVDIAASALEKHPDHPHLLCAKAVALGKLAILSDSARKVRFAREAHTLASRAIERNPSIIYAHIVLGAYHREVAMTSGIERTGANLLLGGLPEGCLRTSIQHLENALSLDQENPHARYEFALTLDAMGRTEQARQMLNALVREPPRNAGTRVLQALADEKLDALAE